MNILLIDDDPIWLIKLDLMLEEIGLKNIQKCSAIIEAEKIIETDWVDLIITDVVLDDELVFKIKPLLVTKKIPCIFISAAPIENNYDLAKTITNSRFLIKPFHYLTLKSTIESLVTTLNDDNQKEKGLLITAKFKQKIIIKFEDILWLEAERNYTIICILNQKKHVIKKALIQVATELDKRFLQVHRSIIVNTDYITKITFMEDKIYINGNHLKIGRSFKSAIATFVNSK